MNEDKEKSRRLYRSRIDRFIAGVCGGMAEYFAVDANIFRILFVILAFFGGIGLILYLAAIIIVPENPSQEAGSLRSTKDKTVFWGWLFVIIGLILLFREFGLFEYFQFWRIPWTSIWALFLIAIGIVLILSIHKAPSTDKPTEEGGTEVLAGEKGRQIYRSRDNRMLAGVCAGIANYFNIDPSLVRVLWVLATLASVGLGVLAYVLLIFVFPEEVET